MIFTEHQRQQLREMAVYFTEQDSSNFYHYFYSHGPNGLLTVPAGKRLVIHFGYEDDPNRDLLQAAFDNGRAVGAVVGELEY